jgi:hypothetical protein
MLGTWEKTEIRHVVIIRNSWDFIGLFDIFPGIQIEGNPAGRAKIFGKTTGVVKSLTTQAQGFQQFRGSFLTNATLPSFERSTTDR